MKKLFSMPLLMCACAGIVIASPTSTPETTISYEQAATKSQQVDYVEFSFTDLLGSTKSILRPLHYFEKDMQEGIAFDGSSVFGCSQISESDMLLKPDLEAVTQLPWTNTPTRTARVTCDIYKDENQPHTGDPRYILKQTLAEAAALGYDFLVGPELEFFIFKDEDGKRVPYDMTGYCSSSSTVSDDTTRAMLLMVLQAVGIPIEKLHHEVAPGQYEVSIAYNNALKIADLVIMAKHTLKALLKNEKLDVTFMPKPLGDKSGSGMHIHFSIWDRATQQNLFYNPQDPYRLSPLAKSFIAGVLYHAPALTLLFNPSVNSYKRLVPGFEAPIYVCCGQKNRSALIRLPETGEHPSAMRAEIRSPDGLCNPYLAFAGILKAGLDGIAKNRTLPEIFNTNLYRISAQALEEKGILTLPHSFEMAIHAFERSELMQQLLGTHAHTLYAHQKRKELQEFNATITEWEFEKYF